MRTERTNAEHPKGVVIVSHGFGEHAGSYKEPAERLAEAGYSSIVFDQRGHGDLPEKSRGVVPSYESFLDDIAALVTSAKEETPGVPFVLYGHSMGGNIAVNYLLRRGQTEFACAILEAPWFGLYRKISPAVAALAKIIGGITPNAAIVNALAVSDITGDKAKAAEFTGDPLYHNRISLRLFAGINSACAYALNNAPRLSIPVYLAIAGNDRIVSNRAIDAFRAAAGQAVVSKVYNSLHSIHSDVRREDFFKDMINFINGHCPAARHD